MPNARQTSLIASPSSSQATNRRRSSITEHSFHGIHASPGKGKVLPMCPVRSVTYVSGRSTCEPDSEPFRHTSRKGPGDHPRVRIKIIANSEAIAVRFKRAAVLDSDEDEAGFGGHREAGEQT